MAWLEFGGRLRKLPDEATVVGGAAGAGLVVEGVDLLPRHFWIEPDGDGVRVRPYATESVVAVDGNQIGTAWCSAAYGATISAGSAQFHVLNDASAVSRSDAAVAPATAFLVDLAANAAYPLDHRTTNVGRARSNHVRLTDPTASRFHAQLRREAGGWVLHPSGSSGAQVNGHRVGTPRLLEDGDEVELAFQRFRFVRGAPPAGATIVPRAEGGDAERSERPTIARGRISMVPMVDPPRHPATRALLLGIVLVVLALAAIVLFRRLLPA